MNDAKKMCPKCKTMTMEPAEGVILTEKEYQRMEPGPVVFKGRHIPFQCANCKYVGYEPESQ
jgi:hypothetical protein